ncbi:MAG: hypothetical protein PHU43_08075 [Candidatus Bipolaricaulis sp.]|nr:hypothetical protein [Candidatus Bipolaricaulis sp.]
MIKWILAVLALACLGITATSEAAELTGSFYAEGNPYPSSGVGGGGAVTLTIEGWTVTNTTTFDVWPEFADSQRLEIERTVGDLGLLTTALFSSTAATFEPLDVALSGDVWTAEFALGDGAAEVTCSAGAGITLSDPTEIYEFVDATVAVGGNYLTHSTILRASPAGLESLVDAYASVTVATIGDGDAAVSLNLSGFVETCVVPLEFSYATLKLKASLGRASLAGIVVYSGGTDFSVALRLATTFGPIVLDD